MKHSCPKCGYRAAAEQFGDGCPACEAEIPVAFTCQHQTKFTQTRYGVMEVCVHCNKTRQEIEEESHEPR